MSTQVAADPRMAFVFPDEPEPGPTPAPARAARPASEDPGPAQFHRIHGAIGFSDHTELRVTTQARRGPECPARIVIRRWFRRSSGVWWTDPSKPGLVVLAQDARVFGAAVAAAVAALEQSSGGGGEP